MRRILLVEDHDELAELMVALLEGLGYQVQRAANVAAALDAAQQPFDVLLSDMSLPDGSALDLMRHLRAQNRPPVPGVLLSGYEQEQIAGAREAGFTEHLTKPVEADDLRAAIERVAKSAGKSDA